MDMFSTKPLPLPIYIGWDKFGSVLDHFKANGFPPAIDRHSIAPAIKGGAAYRAVSGMKAIGWIDDEGQPTEDLKSLVEARKTLKWKETLTGAIQRAYPFLGPMYLQALSSEGLREKFRNHLDRDDDETLRKCEMFLLKAAADAGMPISKELGHRIQNALVKAETLRKNRSGKAPKSELKGAHKTNGAVKSPEPAKPEMDQLLHLVALVDDDDMTEKERDAVFTLMAYIKRRMKQ